MVYVIISSIMLSSLAEEAREINCDYRGFPDTRCKTLIPHCEAFKVSRMDSQSTNGVYSCIKCEDGFVPTDPQIGSVEDQYYPDSVLYLCKRVTWAGALLQSHHTYERELPLCEEYTVTDINEKDNTAVFSCMKCDSTLHHTPINGGVRGSIDQDQTKTVCVRNEGIYECGDICQSREFPGCRRFQVTGRKIDTTVKDRVVYRADLMCIQPVYGFESIMDKLSVLIDLPGIKDLVIPEYLTPFLNCTDPSCRYTIPKCDQFYWVGSTLNRYGYTCNKCSYGYTPLKYEVSDEGYDDLVSKGRMLALCTIEEQVIDTTNDSEWRKDVPGCNKVSVSNVHLDTKGRLVADYRCVSCDEGYEQIPYDAYTFGVFDRDDSTKYLCRPIPTPEDGPSIECDDHCRFMMTNCKEVKRRYGSDKGQLASYVEFLCTRCDRGFNPSGNWTESYRYDWIVYHDVCDHIVTGEPIECDDECKDVYPHCNSLLVTWNAYQDDIYQCLECDGEYYPMDYEDDVKGRISNIGNSMRNTREIHLCSPLPSIIYTEKTDCRLSDNLYDTSDYELCMHSKCRLLVEEYNTYNRVSSLVCLQCADGYTLLYNSRRSLYDEDWDYCIPASYTESQSGKLKKLLRSA